MTQKEEVQEKPASGQTESTALIPIVEIASIAQWEMQVALLNRRSTDLIACDTVAQGYMAHGHPSSMGFVHLNMMTSSRMRKKFPFYDRNDPLFAMLEAKVKYIVGQGILKKYECRKRGEYIDYAKWIDKEAEKVFDEFRNWKPHFEELTNGHEKADNE